MELRASSGRPSPCRRFRLGVDFHTWDGIFQGTRSHILGLYREAVALAPHVDFFFFLDGVQSLRDAHEPFSAPNVRLVKMPRRGGLSRLVFQLPLLQRRLRLDLLHTQYRLPFLSVGPCAVTIHDILHETLPHCYLHSYVWDAKLTFRHAARRAKTVFTVSEFSKREIAAQYAVPSGRIHVTPNAIDSSRFYPAQGPDSRLDALGLSHQGYILNVGRLEPRKNHLALLDAYSQLPANAPPLAVVGQRDFGYQAIFRRIRELRLQNRVRFFEKISDDFLPVIMRHAALFVFPAISEGFGLPVLEAMASGVPVLASRAGALAEIGGDAIVPAPPHDSRELARLVQWALSDESLRSRMAAQGLAQAAMFQWSCSAQILLRAICPPSVPRRAYILDNDAASEPSSTPGFAQRE